MDMFLRDEMGCFSACGEEVSAAVWLRDAMARREVDFACASAG